MRNAPFAPRRSRGWLEAIYSAPLKRPEITISTPSLFTRDKAGWDSTAKKSSGLYDETSQSPPQCKQQSPATSLAELFALYSSVKGPPLSG